MDYNNIFSTYTDAVIAAVFVLYAYFGYRSGFLRSLLAPVSMIFCIVASFVYFQQTRDLAVSLAIGLAGPVIFKLVFSFIHFLLHKSSDKKDRPNFISRLLGAGVCLSWISIMMFFLVFLVAIAPPSIEAIKPIKEDLFHSNSFQYLMNYIESRFPSYASMMDAPDPDAEPLTLEEMQSIDEYEELMEDEKVQALLSDEKVMESFENKDYSELLNNEKIFAILEDPDLLAKFMTFYMKLKERNALGAAVNENQPAPLIIDMPQKRIGP